MQNSANGSTEQSQKALEATLSNTATADAKHGGPLLDFHDDMKGNLPKVVAPMTGTGTSGVRVGLMRQDTDSQSVDEFVDAEG